MCIEDLITCVEGATVRLQALWSVQEDGSFLLADMA